MRGTIQRADQLHRVIPAVRTVSVEQASIITGRTVDELVELRISGSGPLVRQSPFDGELRYSLDGLHRWLGAKS